MKLLIITSVIPYPLSEGGKISQFAFLQYLQDRVDLSLLVPLNNKSDIESVSGMAKALPNVDLHVVKFYDEGRSHWQNVTVSKFKSIVRKLISRHSKGQNADGKARITVNTDFLHPVWFLDEIDYPKIEEIALKISDINPDLIQVEHNGFLNLVCGVPAIYKTIFVEHEIQFARLDSAKSSSRSSYEDYKLNYTKELELSLLRKYSTIITLSEDDKNKLMENGVASVEASPFPVLDSEFEITESPAIDKLVFVGGEAHFPNKDAIEWYLNTIAGEVYRNTNLKLHIIGNWSRAFVEKHKSQFVVFEGFVNDLKLACRNSLMVVPLRIGSGIRTKILYGMAQSLPIISTTIGCEGLGAKAGEEIVIADDIRTFADEIISLSGSHERIGNLSRNAYSFARTNFSQEVLGEKRLSIYKNLIIQ